jgi:hypothetical protein
MAGQGFQGTWVKDRWLSEVYISSRRKAKSRGIFATSRGGEIFVTAARGGIEKFFLKLSFNKFQKHVAVQRLALMYVIISYMTVNPVTLRILVI